MSRFCMRTQTQVKFSSFVEFASFDDVLVLLVLSVKNNQTLYVNFFFFFLLRCITHLFIRQRISLNYPVKVFKQAATGSVFQDKLPSLKWSARVCISCLDNKNDDSKEHRVQFQYHLTSFQEKLTCNKTLHSNNYFLCKSEMITVLL